MEMHGEWTPVSPLHLVSGVHPLVTLPSRFQSLKKGLFFTHFFIPKGKPAAYSGAQHEFCRHDSFPPYVFAFSILTPAEPVSLVAVGR